MATDEAYEAAALALGGRYEPIPGYQGTWAEFQARRAVDAVWDLAVAEGRRQAAEAIRAADVQMIADLEGDTARVGLTVAARIAAGETP